MWQMQLEIGQLPSNTHDKFSDKKQGENCYINSLAASCCKSYLKKIFAEQLLDVEEICKPIANCVFQLALISKLISKSFSEGKQSVQRQEEP